MSEERTGSKFQNALSAAAGSPVAALPSTQLFAAYPCRETPEHLVACAALNVLVVIAGHLAEIAASVRPREIDLEAPKVARPQSAPAETPKAAKKAKAKAEA